MPATWKIGLKCSKVTFNRVTILHVCFVLLEIPSKQLFSSTSLLSEYNITNLTGV
jgi:hypothetical protein